MKFFSICLCLAPLASAFVAETGHRSDMKLHATTGRSDFVKAVSVASLGLLGLGEPAFATGRATLDQSYERYAPRIRAGGAFYQGDFKQMVAKADWVAIKEATGGVPPRKKEDLTVCVRCKC